MPIRLDLIGLTATTLLTFPALAQDAATWENVDALFQAQCVMCHGGDEPRRGLSLETFEQSMAGSENGPVLVAGDPEASELYLRVTGASMPQMPLNGDPLTQEQIDLIAQWIEAGLPGPTP